MGKKLEAVYPQSFPPGQPRIKQGPQCPKCGALTVVSVIPCPDPPKEISPGVYRVCAAIHMGWRCESCGTCYREVAT